MRKPNEISLRIATLLLMQDGEITLKDLEALPFVDNPEQAAMIAARLSQAFEVETYQRRTQENEIMFWEHVIRLKSTPNRPKPSVQKAQPKLAARA